MANLKPSISGGYIYVRYREDGKLHQKYIGKDTPSNRKKAEEFLAQLDRNTHKELSKYDLTIEDAIYNFGRYKERALGKIPDYLPILENQLLMFFGARFFASNITEENTKELVDDLRSRLTGGTMRSYLNYIRAFYFYLYNNRLIHKNYLSKIDGKILGSVE